MVRIVGSSHDVMAAPTPFECAQEIRTRIRVELTCLFLVVYRRCSSRRAGNTLPSDSGCPVLSREGLSMLCLKI